MISGYNILEIMQNFLQKLKLIKKIPRSIVVNVQFNKMIKLDINCVNNIELFYKGKKILIVPIGECCSISYIIQFKKYPFSNLKGKIIKGIYKINDDKLLSKNFKYTRMLKSSDPDWNVRKCHIYKIEIENGNDMYFGLVNNSNGYYDGWIEIYKCK